MVKKDKVVDIEKLREQQRKMRERAYIKAKAKQKLLLKDRRENPEKYYKKPNANSKPIKQKKPIARSTKPIKCKQKTARKTKEPYQSIFTTNMRICFFSGDTYNVEPHHIFEGPDKTSSEIFHFMLPLRCDWHRTANYSIHLNRKLDVQYKMLCQEYWLTELHRKREEWNDYFLKWYTEADIPS